MFLLPAKAGAQLVSLPPTLRGKSAAGDGALVTERAAWSLICVKGEELNSHYFFDPARNEHRSVSANTRPRKAERR
jgi:hypothetical protein